MKRKLLCLFLSFIFLFSFFSLEAYAARSTEKDQITGVSKNTGKYADEGKRIGNENGFQLRCADIIEAYNGLISGKDPNYPDTDEQCKIVIKKYGESSFNAFIRVGNSTNQFVVFFQRNDELIFDLEDDSIPDQIMIWTRGRKDLVERDDSMQMLPEIFAAFLYLCDSSIEDSTSAKKRADEIMSSCSKEHDWVQDTGFDYYCATSPIKEADGHTSINFTIVIKNNGAYTSFEPA